MTEKPNVAVFGWLNDDGTVEWRRDRIIDSVRKVIQGWTNSTAFTKKVDAEFDKKGPFT